MAAIWPSNPAVKATRSAAVITCTELTPPVGA
jgi:hypothetical protein